eukprot:m.1444468 g.1444468  ORF g.1444468 m.1444468 type:complete len:358 (-) comp25105_c0_seq7:2232-3305(-)
MHSRQLLSLMYGWCVRPCEQMRALDMVQHTQRRHSVRCRTHTCTIRRQDANASHIRSVCEHLFRKPHDRVHIALRRRGSTVAGIARVRGAIRKGHAVPPAAPCPTANRTQGRPHNAVVRLLYVHRVFRSGARFVTALEDVDSRRARWDAQGYPEPHGGIGTTVDARARCRGSVDEMGERELRVGATGLHIGNADVSSFSVCVAEANLPQSPRGIGVGAGLWTPDIQRANPDVSGRERNGVGGRRTGGGHEGRGSRRRARCQEVDAVGAMILGAKVVCGEFKGCVDVAMVPMTTKVPLGNPAVRVVQRGTGHLHHLGMQLLRGAIVADNVEPLLVHDMRFEQLSQVRLYQRGKRLHLR